MTPSEILEALSQGHERWPGDALEAASSQRSKVSSLLLEKLAQAVAEVERFEAAEFPKPSLKRFLKAPSPLFYGVFLLADWREKAAYLPFARLMRFPWVAHDNLLGEPAIEEPGYRNMASLFDGDPQFIFDILDVGADPSVSFWQCHALTLIVFEWNLDRAVAADFARQAFGKLSRAGARAAAASLLAAGQAIEAASGLGGMPQETVREIEALSQDIRADGARLSA